MHKTLNQCNSVMKTDLAAGYITQSILVTGTYMAIFCCKMENTRNYKL